MPRMLGYASKQPFRVGKPKVQDLVAGPGTISDAYAYYDNNQASQLMQGKDLVNMVACQAGDPNCGPNVLQMLTDCIKNGNCGNIGIANTLVGRNPAVQSQIRGGAANALDAYYRMGNVGRGESQMMTGPQRLRAVSDMLNRESVQTAMRGVPLVGTAAAGLGTLAAIDAVTESPEERQIREALAAIQYMGA
jgi:hypothetical protein